MKTTIYRVNEQGLREIRDFLAANHKLGGDYFTRSMLDAWADEAEDQLEAGNPPVIELRPWDSVHGHAVEFEISSAGFDAEVIDLDD